MIEYTSERVNDFLTSNPEIAHFLHQSDIFVRAHASDQDYEQIDIHRNVLIAYIDTILSLAELEHPESCSHQIHIYNDILYLTPNVYFIKGSKTKEIIEASAFTIAIIILAFAIVLGVQSIVSNLSNHVTYI